MSSIYGYDVRSELALERLRSAPGARGELTIEVARSPVLDRTGELLAWAEGPDESVFATAATGDGLAVACSATGDYLVQPGRGRVLVEPRPGVTPWFLEHRLVSTIVPTLLSERGDLMLHASAVEVDGRAVVFCGSSGRGKSTLALALLRQGVRILAEDGVAVSLEGRTAHAWPGARDVRMKAGQLAPLHPDYESGLHPTADDGGEGVPVAALVALGGRSGELSVQALDGPRGLVEMSVTLMHRGGIEGLRSPLGALARVVECTPAYLASMPDDLALAPEAALELVSRVTTG